MLNEIKTVVFDLDGTIYQDLTFHSDYLRFMLEGSGREDWLLPLIAYVDEVFAGKHLEMNSFYQCEPVVPKTIEQLFSQLSEGKRDDITYDEAIQRKEYIYLGDSWAVLTYIGKSMGLLEGSAADTVYKKTREKMERDGRQGNERLKNALVKLGKVKCTVLLSNSYEKTAMEFLRQLGFEQAFDKMGFSASKPDGLCAALEAVQPGALQKPATVLTVGDHAFNDLMPLSSKGCKTLWVNPYHGIHKPQYDYCVGSMEELAAFLEDMCHET